VTSHQGVVILPVCTALLALALVGANAQRFIGATPVIRAKDLSFLPSPVVAELLCLGHRNSAAKLRWIDSFAYFQLQIDRRDDRIAGSSDRVYDRLYRSLIHLDPRFPDFYDHVALNIAGIQERPGAALGFFLDGLLWQPHSTSLWRQSAVTLKTAFSFEERNPIGMNGFLDAWSEAETTADGKQMVWDWKASFARRVPQGLEQIPFWFEQLHRTTPGSPTADHILGVLREQLARFGEAELSALQRATGSSDLAGCLDSAAVTARYGSTPPILGPVMLVDGRPTLRSDPFGHAWSWKDRKPVSPGLVAHRARSTAGYLTMRLQELAIAQGRWPATMAEATALGLTAPPAPPGCAWRVDGRAVVVDLPPAPEPAWTFPR
jgi:hypothetical protein